MKCLLFFIGFCAVSSAEPGYGHYKIRPPPPGMMSPGSIHYGPLPPIQRSPYQYIHPHRPPPFPPKSGYVTRHIPRLPPPYYKKNTIRDYPRLPAFGPSPKPAINFNHWKNLYNPNAFRAPVEKETFNPPPSSNTPPLIHDDGKGPIHTIPAPDLSLADKPHQMKAQDPENDLVAVLRHGINNVNVRNTPSYEVTEDPSVHTLAKGEPSYFAPDPDPYTPTLKVPPTTDPHSIPSNGQVPLDLYLQQEADKQHQQLHKETTVDSSNTLTAQDLFNLLNYQQGEPSAVAPLYTPTALFSPQFQTFNYDEQTQQGAYGSSIFPVASMAVHLGDFPSGLHQVSNFKSLNDNDISGSGTKEVFRRHNDIDAAKDSKAVQKNEPVVGKDEYRPTKAHVKAPSQPIETEYKISQTAFTTTLEPNTSTVNDTTEATEITQPPKTDEDFQLQKSIQIYETSFEDDDPTGSSKPNVDDDMTRESLGDVASSLEDAQTQASENLPYGARIRPKRF